MEQYTIFFLGGYDLEMVTIRELLVNNNQVFCDKHLSWGAKASEYRNEIAAAPDNCDLVLIELTIDYALPKRRLDIIDHHGEVAGENRLTSLEQVFTLLKLDSSNWTRGHALIAANDCGYIEGMQAIGATAEEIHSIRRMDREAQGISVEEEIEGERAVARAESLLSGKLTLVRLSHNRTATVTDRLHLVLGGPGFENLLVVCPDQVNFFGIGMIVKSLNKAFPGGWFGGALPTRGFWGIQSETGDFSAQIIDYLQRLIMR